MIVYLSEYIYPKVAEMLRQHATVVDNFHRIEEIDAIILWNIPVTAEMMDRAKKLKVIAKHGIGATELAAATLKKEGYLPEVDLYKLLDNLDQELIPAMTAYHYHVAVDPVALMLGLAGCHSNYLPMFRKVAEEEHVSLLRLIADGSVIDRKAPSETLVRQAAAQIR